MGESRHDWDKGRSLGVGMRQSADVCEPVPRAGAVFDGGAGTIAAARGVVSSFLTALPAQHGVTIPPDTLDSARLVVSELVTNACKHAPGPCFMDIETDGTRLQISVWDSDSSLPQASAPDPDRIGQHGLEIVLALCDSLEFHPETLGKRVTARLPLNPNHP
jgi:anti-sigma regulatory factor (Ser/Thr protein kinase)